MFRWNFSIAVSWGVHFKAKISVWPKHPLWFQAWNAFQNTIVRDKSCHCSARQSCWWVSLSSESFPRWSQFLAVTPSVRSLGQVTWTNNIFSLKLFWEYFLLICCSFTMLPDWAAWPHVVASDHGLGGSESSQTEGRWVQLAQMCVCSVLQPVPSTVAVFICLHAGQSTERCPAWLPCGKLQFKSHQCQVPCSCHDWLVWVLPCQGKGVWDAKTTYTNLHLTDKKMSFCGNLLRTTGHRGGTPSPLSRATLFVCCDCWYIIQQCPGGFCSISHSP